jgi:hypothetical protein
MKKFVILVLLSLVMLPAFSQEEKAIDKKTARKLAREQKLEQERINKETMAKMVDLLVETRRFVVKANYLSNQTGERIMVSDELNFIVVDSAKITIQIASTYGIGGANGMGGITADGSITQYEVKKVGKNKNNYSIRIFAMTSVGSYDIFLTISPSSYTDATITGNTRGRLNYHGVIVPIKGSRIFKGMSI